MVASLILIVLLIYQALQYVTTYFGQLEQQPSITQKQARSLQELHDEFSGMQYFPEDNFPFKFKLFITKTSPLSVDFCKNYETAANITKGLIEGESNLTIVEMKGYQSTGPDEADEDEYLMLFSEC